MAGIYSHNTFHENLREIKAIITKLLNMLFSRNFPFSMRTRFAISSLCSTTPQKLSLGLLSTLYSLELHSTTKSDALHLLLKGEEEN